MKLLQFNIQSLKKDNNKELLELTLVEKKIDIAILCETWLQNNSCASLANFNFYGKYRPDGYGGVGMYINKSIKYSIININSTAEAIGITTLNLKNNINIFCIYCPPNMTNNLFKNEIEKIFIMAGNLRKKTIIGGDFNCKSTVWGSAVSNTKGTMLEAITFDNNFICLNDGHPTFQIMTHESHPDVTFSNINPGNIRWSVLPNKITNSNHLPITIELNSIQTPKTKIKKIIQSKFIEEIKNCKLGNTLQEVTDTFNKIKHSNTIQIQDQNHYIPKKWWNKEIDRLYKLRNNARKRYETYKNLENLNKLTDAQKNLQGEIAKRKKENFNDLIEEITAMRDSKQMWRKINNIKKYGCSKKINNSWTNEENMNYLKHITNNDNSNALTNLISINLENSELPEMTPENFNRYLHKRKPDSAAGYDGISYKMLQNLPYDQKNILFNIIINIWKEGKIPDEWRIIKIIPILKPMKEPGSITNYRPIALLPTIYKLLEGIMKFHLENTINQSDLIPPRSYAFRKRRSTTFCINDVINTVLSLKSRNNHVAGACVDIEKAYDNVNINKLSNILTDMGITHSIVQWLQNFLNKRILKLGNHSIITNKGLLQGSSLSPVLFNLYTAGLHNLNDANTTLFQFADDFFIISAHKDFNIVKDNLKNKIVEFTNNCKQIDLKLNLNKTNVIHFSNKKQIIDIQINNTSINQVDSIKYLGRYISKNNSANIHVNEITNKIHKDCNFLNILSGCKFGISPNKALQFYKAFARAKIEYAASSFANLSKTASAKLVSCNNRILRKCLGLIRSTPTHVIYHMAAELPLEYRFRLTTAKEIIKNFAYELPITEILLQDNLTFNTSYTTVYKQYDDIFNNIAKIPTPSSSSNKTTIDIQFFKGMVNSKKNASKEQIQQLFNTKMEELKSKNLEIIFTDGSVKENTTNAAFFHDRTNTTKAFYINKILSSMSAELIAFEKAIDFATTFQYQRVAILTDSKSGAIALLNEETNNSLIITLLNKINTSNIITLEIHYIPSHSGIHQNCVVDRAAKLANTIGEEISIEWNIKDAIKEVGRRLSIEWQGRYSEISNDKGKKYNTIFPELLKTPWFHKLNPNLEAKQIRQINRILSGHAFCRHTLAKFKVADDTLCETCNIEDTPEHIILKCNKYNNIRAQHPKLIAHTSLELLYKTEDSKTFYILSNFLKHTRITL